MMPLVSMGGSQSTRIVCLETGMARTLLGGPGTETEHLLINKETENRRFKNLGIIAKTFREYTFCRAPVIVFPFCYMLSFNLNNAVINMTIFGKQKLYRFT